MSWFVVDNGAGHIKFGLLGQAHPTLMPNCTGRYRKDIVTLVGPILDGAASEDQQVIHGNLLYTRPHERGYLTNVDCEVQIWDKMMEMIGGTEQIAGLVVTVPPLMPNSLTVAMEDLFQHFRFHNVVKKIPAELASLRLFPENQRFCLVVDSGYSFTHIIPVFDGKAYEPAIKRIDVGGKLLTNYMKEMISYNQVFVMDETFVVDQMKREVCYVSLDIEKDMNDLALLQRQPHLPRRQKLPMEKRREMEARFIQRYVLPDYQRVKSGYILAPNVTADEVAHLQRQIVTLSGEPFLVPEVLFNPSNVGLKQAGIPEVIQHVIENCPIETRKLLKANVVLIGGNMKFPNILQRIQNELGPEYSCQILEDPVEAPWQGAKHLKL